MNISIETIHLTNFDRWTNGSRLVAIFDVEIGPLAVRGCTMTCTGRGFFLVKGPKGNMHGSRSHAVVFRDKELRERVRDAVLPAYYALGGEKPLDLSAE